MPVYTFPTAVVSDALNDLYFTFNNTSGKANLWMGGQSNPVQELNAPTSGNVKSRIRLDDGDFVLGSDYTGTIADFKLTYGDHSPEYVQNLRDKTVIRGLFGYRFDTYRTGTNNEFSDSMGINTMSVQNNKVSLTTVGYIDFVSSVEFAATNTDSYMITKNTTDIKFMDYDYDVNGLSVCFWVDRAATGIIFHLDNFMTIEMKNGSELNVSTSQGTGSITITNTYANTEYNADMCFVMVTLPSKDSSSCTLLFDGLTSLITMNVNSGSPIANDVVLRKMYIGHDGTSSTAHFKGTLDAVFGFASLTPTQAANMYLKFKSNDVFTASSAYLEQSKISSEWSHVAATYSDARKELSVFHNGELFTTYENYIPNTSDVAQETMCNVLVGAGPDSTFFGGGLDDVRVYNSVLEPRDVHEVYSRYYDHQNLNGHKLIGAGAFDSNDVVLDSNRTLNVDDVSYTITINSATPLTCKVFAISDHHLSSRQVLDKLLLAESSLVTDFHEFTSTATSQTLSNVTVVSSTEPELTFVETDIANVNALSIFVHVVRDDGDEMVIREDVHRGTAGVPTGRLDIVSSDTELKANVFSANKRLSKFFTLFSSNASETNATVKTGTVAFVDTTPNQLMVFTVDKSARSGYSYCHLLVIDEDSQESDVFSLDVSSLSV